ncbi:MAG: Rrf2 family transcriptional regulator [Anaerolineae bacterium]|nr:Rrf2 family transcriptional regulator [Anaerolineales bacterium]MCQ3976406.1 Rrf2 family transcriptional regulator [Anaerolineae bacterium]
MFPLTRRADYAVRIMLELGDKAESGQRTPATQVAQKAGIPLAFLRKIVVDLVRVGLVRAYSGPTGGLILAQPTETINLVHILEAIEGPICLNICLVRPKECPRDQICPVHGFLGQLQTNLIQQLQAATLDKLVAEKRELERRPGASKTQITLF